MPIICKLCNTKLKRLTPTHLQHKHNGMTMVEYREMFPDAPTLSLEARRRANPQPIKYTITCPNCGETKMFEKKSLCAYERKFCCHSCANSYNSKARWEDPKHRDKMLEIFQAPEHRTKLSKLGTERWEDPEYRSKYEGERNIEYTVVCPNCGETRTFIKDHPCSYENKFCDRTCSLEFRWKDPERYEQICRSMSQAQNTVEMKQKKSKLTKEQWADPKIRTKRLKGMRATMQTEEYKEKQKASWTDERREIQSKRIQEQWEDPKYRTKTTEAIRKTCNEPAQIARLSSSAKERWKDPEYRKACTSGFRNRPTKPELELFQFLNENNYPYIYTGDGSLWIGGRNPDLVFPEQNKIIEMFGNYWHNESEIKPRVDYFTEYGYATLIIWDYELKDTEQLLTKLKDFHQD